jgi:hypothetical protein
MKELYTKPEVQVDEYEAVDVLTISGGETAPGNEQIDDPNNDD